MTDEEYDALDEYWTKHTPKLGPNGTGGLSQRNMRLMGLSNMTIDYLMTKAKANNKPPSQIIDELIVKEITAAAV